MCDENLTLREILELDPSRRMSLRQWAEGIVRRAARVVRAFHPGMFQPGEVRNAMDVYAAIANAILADAGLDEEKRDE